MPGEQRGRRCQAGEQEGPRAAVGRAQGYESSAGLGSAAVKAVPERCLLQAAEESSAAARGAGRSSGSCSSLPAANNPHSCFLAVSPQTPTAFVGTVAEIHHFCPTNTEPSQALPWAPSDCSAPAALPAKSRESCSRSRQLPGTPNRDLPLPQPHRALRWLCRHLRNMAELRPGASYRSSSEA